MDPSPSKPLIQRIGVGTLAVGAGTAFASAAALAGAGVNAWIQQAPDLNLLSNLFTGSVVAAGTLAASVFGAQAIKKGVEIFGDEGKMVWEHIAQTTLGKSLSALNDKMGDFKYVAGAAALTAIPAAAFDQIYQAAQNPAALAAIGLGVIAPIAAMEGITEQKKLAERIQARRAREPQAAAHAPRISMNNP